MLNNPSCGQLVYIIATKTLVTVNSFFEQNVECIWYSSGSSYNVSTFKIDELAPANIRDYWWGEWNNAERPSSMRKILDYFSVENTLEEIKAGLSYMIEVRHNYDVDHAVLRDIQNPFFGICSKVDQYDDLGTTFFFFKSQRRDYVQTELLTFADHWTKIPHDRK